MKLISNIKKIAFCCFILSIFYGCGDRYDAIESNNAYIKGAYSEKYAELYLETTSDSHEIIPINLTQKDDENEIVVSVGVATEEIEKFNEKYNRNYILYPTDMWSFDNEKVTIKKGYTGSGIGLTIRPISEELSNTGNIYVIPVKITNADKAGVLRGSDFFFYILRRKPITDVASTTSSQRIKFKMDHLGEKIVFNELTVEFMFNIVGKYNTANNQGLFYNNGRTEEDGGQIFSRLEGGSGGLKAAKLEWNIGGGEYVNASPSSGEFKIDTWYHVALVFGNKEIKVYIDGKLVASKDVGRTYITAFTAITNTPGWDGFVWDGAKNNTKFAEVRLWNVVRTQDQVQENMYQVNPETEGLLGYWRINDGSGNILKNQVEEGDVGHGYIHQSNGSLEWHKDENISVGQ